MLYFLDPLGGHHHRLETDIFDVPVDWIPTTPEVIEDLEFHHAVVNGGTMPQTKGPELFLKAFKNALGGIVGMNAFMTAYPAFMHAFDTKTWDDVQVLIVDAHTTRKLTDTQYADIKAAAEQYLIPINL